LELKKALAHLKEIHFSLQKSPLRSKPQHGMAGRVSEIDEPQYFIARKEKGDILYLWKKFLQKM
jgi:hypothetical protein